MTTVLKLGGSVITAKDEPETVDEDALGRVVRDVAGADTGEGLLVVHGGGSFGHHHADRVGVTRTDGTDDADGILAVHDAMRTLNAAVVDRLRTAGLPAIPVHPFSVAARNDDAELSMPVDSVTAMLGESFVPVLHGDVVTHEGKGATILSGDELVVSLAGALEAERVGLCSAVPGVLDEEGAVIDRVDSFEAVASALGESDSTDVTGGMAGKVRALLELPVPAHIFDGQSVAAFLDGDSPGTVVDGSQDGH